MAVTRCCGGFLIKEVNNVERIAVKCDSKEEWEEIQKIAFKEGKKWWSSGDKIVRDYSHCDGYIGFDTDNTLMSNSKEDCIKHDYQIINFGEYLNEGGRDVNEFKVGDRVEVVSGNHRQKQGIVKIVDGFSVGVEFDEHINGNHCKGTAKDGHGYWKDKPTLKLIIKTQTTKENKMNKNISEVFDKTKDALLVEKHLGGQLGSTFIDGLILADKKTEVLAEAKRLEKEEKADK